MNIAKIGESYQIKYKSGLEGAVFLSSRSLSEIFMPICAS